MKLLATGRPMLKRLSSRMKIAVEGCCHGELKKIYDELGRLERAEGTKVDLLIICGDFQAIRNAYDLRCLACPPKYRQMGDFHLYHEGKLKAPVPTLFIGGNHEASNYLAELYHGGWVCPNIYFLGFSGVVQFGGLRIGGLSGIHSDHHYDLGYFERPPYDNQSMRSIYHYRRMETWKLEHLQDPLDIFISHEWPTGIYHYGDTASLLHRKPYFKDEVRTNTLGAKPLEELLFKLKPRNWFSAHMHVHFEATVPHPSTSNGPSCETQFLALDKCLPKRKFLKIVEIEPAVPEPKEFAYDEEWLGIIKASDSFMNMTNGKTKLPDVLDHTKVCISEEQRKVPLKFTSTVNKPSNPQTDAFCALLGIRNRFSLAKPAEPVAAVNPEEIEIDL